MSNLFSQMKISDEVKNAVLELGFENATEIQSLSIPLIMSGKDVIGHSQTGTGKTAAFGIPAIEMIDEEKPKSTQVLILCPTRELAVQACDEMRKFAKYKQGIKVTAIFGGQAIDRQFAALRSGANIVVGTPGRVMDHIRRGTLKLENIKMVILDEADEMLSMGFREDIEIILKEIPEERQTVLFSATMSKEIMDITKKYQREPELVKIERKEMTVESIEQIYYEVPKGRKLEVLGRVLEAYDSKRSMVFCNTKKMVDELVCELQGMGFSANGLHGDMNQAARLQIMNSFKKGTIGILVATDVAARGIDVDDIEAVFNYDVPQDIEYYVHRIGRTGRAGKKGRSFTFITGKKQLRELLDIQRFTKSKIELKSIPSEKEIAELRAKKFSAEVKKSISGGGLEKYRSMVDELIDEYNFFDIAAGLIKMIIENDEMPLAKIEEKKAPRERQDRRESHDRRERPETKKRDSKKYNDSQMVTLEINVGKKRKVNPGTIVSSIASETGISGSVFGKIKVQENDTTVDVPREYAEQVLSAMEGCKIMGKKVSISKK